jgi:hypothetical protein
MGRLVLKTLVGVGFAAAALGVSTPAAASIPCSNTDISPTAIDCAGFYPGNPVNSNPVNQPTLTSGLAALGFTYTGDSDGIEQFDANGATVIDFATLLFGQTIIGVHYGNGVGSPGRPTSARGDGDDTAFYLFDAGTIGLDTFTLAFSASSTVTLFQTGSPPPPSVPEPATWAMMLLGFGAAGTALRRSRRKNAKLLQIA